jgi:hypothetical protein
VKALRVVLMWGGVVHPQRGFPGIDCQTHTPVPPLVTTDPGGCTVLLDNPAHSSADSPCTGSGEVDDEPNGSLFKAVPLGKAACGGATVPGRLAAPDDADMFSLPSCPLPFLKPDDLTTHATQEPRVTFTGDDNSAICLFASCDYGPTGLAGCSSNVALTDSLVFPASVITENRPYEVARRDVDEADDRMVVCPRRAPS